MRGDCGFQKAHKECLTFAQIYYDMVRSYGKDRYKGSGKNN